MAENVSNMTDRQEARVSRVKKRRALLEELRNLRPPSKGNQSFRGHMRIRLGKYG